MYDVVRGPLVWIALLTFGVGIVIKLLLMVRTVRQDKTVMPAMSLKYSLRSVFHWVIPFGSDSMRQRPLFTTISWVFHLCLLIAPLFVMGHAVLWQESWGVSWWSLPAAVADVMTALVILCGLYFIFRRLTAPEVRNVNTWRDYVVLVIAISPFVTGFVATHQWLPYKATIILHILCGALWLMAIPFSWLQHMFMFFFSRSFMGSEFGAVRNARDW